MTQRLYVPENLAAQTLIGLPRHQAHHIGTVMRARTGDMVLLFNGRDGEWRAEISEISRKACTVVVLDRLRPAQPSPDIMLCFAPLKKDRLDFLVEKATELGASILQPVITARTNVARTNTERLVSQAIEASEQCERLDIPDVREPVKLPRLLRDWPEGRTLLVLDEQGHGLPIAPDLLNQQEPEGYCRPAAVLVGPEGGFAPEEMALVSSLPGVRKISLGPRILRAETAALAALACWQSILGDGRQPLVRP